jgi:hypothetical protein
MLSSNLHLETLGFSEVLIPRIKNHMKLNRSAIHGEKALFKAILSGVNKLPSNQFHLKDHLPAKIITSGASRVTARTATNRAVCFTRSKITITRRKKCILDYLCAIGKAAYKMK